MVGLNSLVENPQAPLENTTPTNYASVPLSKNTKTAPHFLRMLQNFRPHLQKVAGEDTINLGPKKRTGTFSLRQIEKLYWIKL